MSRRPDGCIDHVGPFLACLRTQRSLLTEMGPVPLVSMVVGGRVVAVRRIALSVPEAAVVLGESNGNVMHRLRCNELAHVLGDRRWLVRVEGLVELAEAKVRAGLLDSNSLDRLADLIERPR